MRGIVPWLCVLPLVFGLIGSVDGQIAAPVRLIYDTDMGNDIDDALALAVIHELMDRGEVDLLAVTISKDNPWCAAYVDAVNTFYGRPDIPIAVVRAGPKPQDGSFNRQVADRRENGRHVYPHDLRSGADAPDATSFLRELLAGQPAQSVVIASVGFPTNLSRLLDSTGDSHSSLSGVELVRRKVRLLSWMAGHFGHPRRAEYNAKVDYEATLSFLAHWPTAIVASGWEIGAVIRYPARSIAEDYGYVPDHPIADAYRQYRKFPYDRPTWDLTAVLYAVRPGRDYFGLSYPGTITMDSDSITHFSEHPDGRHQYLTVTPEQIIRVRETLIQLASSPPLR